jgi:uncharacterized protein YchJ
LSELCAGWKQFYKHALDGFQRLAQDVRSERARAASRRGENPLLTSMKDIPAAPVGRNEPCICGSGKKYKKCCGALRK